MNKIILFLNLMITSTFSFAQTESENLNVQIKEMKGYLLDGDYENYANYMYPKVLEIMGGKKNMVVVTENGINNMKAGGLSILNLRYKNSSKFFKKENELQCSLTQVTVMQTPNGKMEKENAFIAISNDNGENWTFINTDNKDKETVLETFSNLHSDVFVKQ